MLLAYVDVRASLHRIKYSGSSQKYQTGRLNGPVKRTFYVYAPKLKWMDLLILTYGAQTWSLTEHQKSKLKICQRAMERSILGVKLKDRVRNTVLRSKTGISDVGVAIAKLKWNWAGHVCRMNPDRWARIATEWVPDGRRKRGRPRRRWRDDFDSYLADWSEKALERKNWPLPVLGSWNPSEAISHACKNNVLFRKPLLYRRAFLRFQCTIS